MIADTYVFSGDGKHGNPERATLEWLTDARGSDAEYVIYLTYSVASIDEKREEDRTSTAAQKSDPDFCAWS